MQNKPVVVIIGAGGIGISIARRQAFGKTVLLADFNEQLLERAASDMRDLGYDVFSQAVDIASRDSIRALTARATALGSVQQVVLAAGLSPNMASPQRILDVDLHGSAMVLEEFEHVIALGGSGVLISSMAGHMPPPLPADQNAALAHLPADELLTLPFLQPDAVADSGQAYSLSKRANQLRVQGASIRWGKKGARINSISPGIIMTPLARHELESDIGPAYRQLIDGSVAKRVGSAEEVAAAAAYLLGPEASFVTGSDLLIDGGVIASMFSGHTGQH
jgi:NAD(P)-dependent dehydrogenase (short-subunit alcohol dehydrogenase family)